MKELSYKLKVSAYILRHPFLANMKIRKSALVSITLFIIASLLTGLIFGFLWGYNDGQTAVWDMIAKDERDLRDIYTNLTQIELKEWLPDDQMNFTDGLIWESHWLNFTSNRPKYENVTQVLRNGIGACGEHVWVYAAFCVAKGIPFRVVTLGYFVPQVVDHSWIQVNPSGDGKTWIHIDVTDTCDRLDKGQTIEQLWNVTINNNSYYSEKNYKMVLAYELNKENEIVITDVTQTFSVIK